MEMENKKIISERAHLMCPNMFFGIMIKIDREFNLKKFEESLQIIQNAHPLITSFINIDEKNNLYFVNRTNFQIPYYIPEDRTWKQIFEDISLAGWDVRKESLLKVYIFKVNDFFQVLLVTHHILCDGRGLLSIAMELADYYVNNTKPTFVDEKLLDKLEDLPTGSNLPFISNYLIKRVNKNWNKEKQTVSYDSYLDFEKEFATENKVTRSMLMEKDSNLNHIIGICKANNISVNDYLVAKLMEQENVNKVIIASDIRKKLHNYQQGTLGNFATAFSVIIKKPSKDILILAKKINQKVQEIRKSPSKEMLVLACFFVMEPTLIDAVVISTLGDFNSKAGKFVGSKMFGYELRNGHSITNLGKIESNSISEGFFIPPASPATKKIWGVVTINGKMKIVEAHY